MKHSLGPWKVFRPANVECPGIDARYVTVVCYGESMTDNAGVQGATLEEARANASLIAAAPDMLAALEAIFDLCSDPEPDYKRIQQCASNAIAKATGEREQA